MIGYAMCSKPRFNGRYKHVKLVDVCEILDSKRIPITKNKRIAGPYPYYGANGIQDHVADFLFDDELVLLAEDGGHFEKYGQIAYRVSGKCWVNNHAHVLKAKNDVDIDYLCYALQSFDVSSLVNGATRKKLTQSAMKKITLPLRSVDVQLAIVNNLKTVEMQLANARKLLSSLDALVKSRFNEAFGDMRTNSKKLPIAVWRDVLIIKNGRNQKAVECTDGPYPICGSGGVMSRASSYITSADSVIIGRKGNINTPILMREPFWNVDTAFGVEPNEANLTVEYLYWFCRWFDFNRLNKAVTIPSLTKTDLYSIQMPLPDMSSQKRFSAFVSQVDKLRFMLLANPSPAFGGRSFCCSTNCGSCGVILDA